MNDTERKRFLVQIRDRDREDIRSEIMTADKIINRIDMSDIYEEELRIFDISRFGCIEELSINGCWADPEDPLYIWCTDTKGKVVIDGYGTDH